MRICRSPEACPEAGATNCSGRGLGPEYFFRLAGQVADIVVFDVSAAALRASAAETMANTQDVQTRQKLEWVKEGAGERFRDLELQVMCKPTITDDPQAAAKSIAADIGSGPEYVLGSALMLIGTIAHICELVERRREEWGVSYFIVPAGMCDAFAPVVARLSSS